MRTKRIIDKMKKSSDRLFRGTTAYLARSLVNPVFAQFETVFLCRFLAVEDRPFDALDFYDRSEAAWTKDSSVRVPLKSIFLPVHCRVQPEEENRQLEKLN
jgi:hypothetical protein